MNLRPCSTLTIEAASRERAKKAVVRQIARQITGCVAVALALLLTRGYWARLVTAKPAAVLPWPWAGNPAEFRVNPPGPPAYDPGKFATRSVISPSGHSPLADAPERRSPIYPTGRSGRP